MSTFSYKVKQEIIQNVSNPVQAKAIMQGIICSLKNISEKGICFTTENDMVKNFFEKNVIKLAGEGSVITSVSPSGSVFTLEVNPQSLEKLLSAVNLAFPISIDQDNLPKQKYIGSFIAGAFLASGSINDPEKKYHFQITFPNEDICNSFINLVWEFYEVSLKYSENSQGKMIYIKESESIEELLFIVGATKCAYEHINARIGKEIHNKVNRVMNCDNANINKSVKASCEQVENIELIEKTIGIENLTPPLQEIAMARLEFPEYSLEELGKHMNPPISRSGANHRLERIAKIAKNIKSDKDENK